MDNNNDNNNNLDEFLLDNNYDNNVNEFNNNDNNNDSFFFFYIFLILFGILILNEVYYLKAIINAYILDPNKLTDIAFETCVKYPFMSQLYASFFYIIFLLGITISVIMFKLLNNEELIKKIIYSYLNLTFYFLGPILTGLCTVGLLFYQKLCYVCINNDPKKIIFDSYTFLTLIIWEFIGINILFGYNNFNCKNIFYDSIRFDENGNYFLGQLFWKATQWRRGNIQNRNN